MKRQLADGGWGWLCDEDSDALGTGIALYAYRLDKFAGDRSRGRQGAGFASNTAGRRFLARPRNKNE